MPQLSGNAIPGVAENNEGIQPIGLKVWVSPKRSDGTPMRHQAKSEPLGNRVNKEA